MSTLFLVRHGQASFGTSNYDQLSQTGIEQARKLGHFWSNRGLEFSEVFSGDLQRQIASANNALETYGQVGGRCSPEVEILPGLNEYNSEHLMTTLKQELAEKHANIALLDGELEKASGYTQKYRAFHRLLEAVMVHYISGEYESSGFETWAAFHTRVSECFQAIRSRTGRGRSVAVFTSGGPIGVMMQLVLSAPQKVALDLHWRIFNCSVTKFTFNTERISLDSFNATDHLPPELLTYR